MSDHSPTNVVSKPTRVVAPTSALKHVRAAALAAALVPLAQVAVTPVSAADCGFSGAPPCPVPEGDLILPMVVPAALFIGYKARKKK